MFRDVLLFAYSVYFPSSSLQRERWMNTSHSQSSTFIRTDLSGHQLAQLNGLLADDAETEGIPDTDPPTAKELIERIVSLLPHSGQSI